MRKRFLLLALALGLLVFLSHAAWAQNAHGNHDPYLFLLGVPPIEAPTLPPRRTEAPSASRVRARSRPVRIKRQAEQAVTRLLTPLEIR